MSRLKTLWGLPQPRCGDARLASESVDRDLGQRWDAPVTALLRRLLPLPTVDRFFECAIQQMSGHADGGEPLPSTDFRIEVRERNKRPLNGN